MTDCICHTWAGDIRHLLLTGHHEHCQKGPTGLDAALALIHDLTEAMDRWGWEEDGIPDHAWDVHRRAKVIVGASASGATKLGKDGAK